MKFRASAILPVAALAIAGCTSSNSGVEVKRFHLSQPITRGTVALVPADGAISLEYQSYADAVANELRMVGFNPIPLAAGPAYVATLSIQQNVQVGPPRQSSVSIGIGGASFGRRTAVGLGGATSFPVGHARRDAVEIDALALQIKRSGDSALVWEGSAHTAIDTRNKHSSLSNAVPIMAHALLTGFPGPSGQTVRYPFPK